MSSIPKSPREPDSHPSSSQAKVSGLRNATSTDQAPGRDNAFGLPKEQRLRKPSQYQKVYKSKQWGGSPLFTYNVRGKEALDQPAVLGVTVSKKVSKSAVVRNRIKRQIKEFYRLNQADLHDAEIIITAKPGSAQASDVERLKSLKELWIKIQKWQRWNTQQERTKS